MSVLPSKAKGKERRVKETPSQPQLRYHDKMCFNCRYYRARADFSDCLLLGRTLSAAGSLNGAWDRARYCDGWKRQPKTWNIYCDNTNPFWHDPYISRETQLRLRWWEKRKP